MAETSIQIKAESPQGASMTTTVNYVNPEATNEQLRLLAMKLNSLTRNEYKGATKVTKEVLI